MRCSAQEIPNTRERISPGFASHRQIPQAILGSEGSVVLLY